MVPWAVCVAIGYLSLHLCNRDLLPMIMRARARCYGSVCGDDDDDGASPKGYIPHTQQKKILFIKKDACDTNKNYFLNK